MAEVEDDTTLEELAAALDRADTEEVAQALAGALIAGWSLQVQQALRAAAEAQTGGATTDELIGVLRAELSRPLRNRLSPQVDEATRLFYRIGKQETPSVGISPVGRRTINFQSNFTTFWIENHYDRFVQDRLRDLSEETFEEGLGAFRRGQRFAQSSLGQQFAKSQSYWELLSNATATRTRELAHIDGYAESGFDEVFIDAVLDRRTSCICRTLDGTRLPVSRLQDWKEEMMDAESPTEVKDRSPWLSCERIRSLETQGAEALLDAGIASPPYHGHCRSQLSVPLD